MIEHYGSGIKRIKKECDQNGNDYPILHNEMGTFSTTYLPRKADDTINAINDTTKHDSDPINEPVNEPVNHGKKTINDKGEVVNEVVNILDDTIKSADDTIKSADDTIKMLLDTINTHEGMKRDDLAAAIHRSIPTVARLLAYLEHEGKIIYRGSKKTGGYYAIEQK